MPKLTPAEVANFRAHEATEGRVAAVAALAAAHRPRFAAQNAEPHVSFLDDGGVLVLPMPKIGPDGKIER